MGCTTGVVIFNRTISVSLPHLHLACGWGLQRIGKERNLQNSKGNFPKF